MKISELVQGLTDILDEDGDVDIVLVKEDGLKEWEVPPTLAKLYSYGLKTGRFLRQVVIESEDANV